MAWTKGDWISSPKQKRADPHTGHTFWNLTNGKATTATSTSIAPTSPAMADGQHVAYAYSCPALGHAWSVRIFNVQTETETTLIEHRFSHFISNRDGTQIIGDDPEHVTLLDVKTKALTPLVRHNQELTIANTHYHPHPAFNPAGDQAVFCMRDERGHNDVCLIDISKP